VIKKSFFPKIISTSIWNSQVESGHLHAVINLNMFNVFRTHMKKMSVCIDKRKGFLSRGLARRLALLTTNYMQSKYRG